MLHSNGKGRGTEAWSADRESSCMLGALQLVAQDEEQQMRLVNRVQKVIKRVNPDGTMFEHYSIPGFNDSTKTTQEDVLLAMKYATEEE